MRTLSLFLLLTALVTGASHAQAPQLTPDQQKAYEQQMHQMQQMMSDPAQMEKMQAAMQAAQNMNQCIQEKIGVQGMEKIAGEGQALHAQTQSLCKAGQRDEAQKLQADYSKKITESPEYKGMKECSDKHANAFKDMPGVTQQMESIRKMEMQSQTTHVCDLPVQQ